MTDQNAPAAIQIPSRTRTLLEQKIASAKSLHTLAQAENQTIAVMIEMLRELLNVPAGWGLGDTAIGFTPPAPLLTNQMDGMPQPLSQPDAKAKP